jgi:hypothetical protein
MSRIKREEGKRRRGQRNGQLIKKDVDAGVG